MKVALDILNAYVEALNRKIRRANPDAETVTRSDAIRRAVIYAYFVGLKGYTVEEAAEVLEKGTWRKNFR